MQIPKIDLTDAARSYGLSYVPPVRQADWVDYLTEGDDVAGFSQSERDIVVFDSLFQPPSSYDQSRFARVGVGPLDTKGKVQFVLAHELWHARQDELDHDGLKWGDIVHSNAEHDSNAYEVSADKHAAKVYSQIKIGD